MSAGLGVLLAAGEGTRMKSHLPKPLHEVAGRSMLAHALAALVEAGCARIAVVVGPGAGGEALAAAARAQFAHAEIFVQSERRGTAHAVLAARAALAQGADDVIVHYADTPLLTGATLQVLRSGLAGKVAVSALGFEPADPTGYGRFIEKDGALIAIREQKDASPAERAIRRCNAGTVALAGAHALSLLDQVTDDNAAREFYLTDLVEIAARCGLAAVATLAAEAEVMGVNDRVQLSLAEAALQKRLREAAMRAGATLIAPDTVFLSYDTVLGRDVVVEPHVVFGRGVRVEDGVVIHAFSHLEGAAVAGRGHPRQGAGRQFRGDQGCAHRGGRQGQPSLLYRRRAGGGGRECRGGYDHLQLRRLRQGEDRHRRRRVRRLELGVGRAGEDRRRGDRRGGLRGDAGRERGRAGAGARRAGGEAGLGEDVSRGAEEEIAVDARVPAWRAQRSHPAGA
jgi:CTP:molybdopterin cytidylyltransferase MocA